MSAFDLHQIVVMAIYGLRYRLLKAEYFFKITLPSLIEQVFQ